ncbi:MAG: 2-oxoacid:acceptor oxidoreductase subunit alpha, partial [Nanoarchaeota archaeon]
MDPKTKNDFVFRIGGEAGWGIATGAELLAQVCLNLGYHVFSSKDYASQIKGGHNYHTIRISLKPVGADVDDVDLLLALDEETLKRHSSKVDAQGIILYEDKMAQIVKDARSAKDSRYFSLPLQKLEKELNEKNIHNGVFVGAAVKIFGIEWKVLEKVLEEFFSGKIKLKEIMLKSAHAGYQAISQPKLSLPASLATSSGKLIFFSGNDAITQGALKAGLKFHAQYPMTPVSGILHNLAKEAESNKSLIVIQPEDEIAAINMGLGASYAGARSMVATSGGGFALMIEALGLAGMAEIPLVIIEGQRPGPATGLPTKTGQGDLKFVLSAAPDEPPRVVIAPGDVNECYTETKRAFYLAEKYQLPVIVLVDKQLTESYQTFDLNEEEKAFIFDYATQINVLEKVSPKQQNADGLYKRYASGNVFRTLPGTSGGVYTCAGDEHDEVGEITEDAEIRKRMVERRAQKLELIQKELPTPELLGVKNTDWVVVSWGSNKGALQEAVDRLNA